MMINRIYFTGAQGDTHPDLMVFNQHTFSTSFELVSHSTKPSTHIVQCKNRLLSVKQSLCSLCTPHLIWKIWKCQPHNLLSALIVALRIFRSCNAEDIQGFHGYTLYVCTVVNHQYPNAWLLNKGGKALSGGALWWPLGHLSSSSFLRALVSCTCVIHLSSTSLGTDGFICMSHVTAQVGIGCKHPVPSWLNSCIILALWI